VNPLADRIKALIRHDGPMSVASYMALALGDPEHGYYATREPFGRGGDFVTAPEVSQMFGELIGLWCLVVWQRMGSPERFELVELGPGRGTLMADLWRAASIRRGFVEAARVHLVETSRRLRAAQAETLAHLPRPPVWHDDIASLPLGPAIIVANEFFDALPVRQFALTEDGWRERLIGLDDDGELAFGLGPGRLEAEATDAPVGTIIETCRPAGAIAGALASRVAAQGGAFLAIDYGYAEGCGDTLQAVRAHAFADPLSEPGRADLTAHVDFGALANAARGAGARVHGPMTQGDFLVKLGLLDRAASLGADKAADARGELTAAVERLAGPSGMGTLFKVLAATSPRFVPPPFDAS
jgi:SAM-dependent MidA family methyltransferase